jgi:hypothetical protein
VEEEINLVEEGGEEELWSSADWLPQISTKSWFCDFWHNAIGPHSSPRKFTAYNGGNLLQWRKSMGPVEGKIKIVEVEQWREKVKQCKINWTCLHRVVVTQWYEGVFLFHTS